MHLINFNLVVPMQLHMDTKTKEETVAKFDEILTSVLKNIEIKINTYDGRTLFAEADHGIQIEVLDVQGEYEI